MWQDEQDLGKTKTEKYYNMEVGYDVPHLVKELFVINSIWKGKGQFMLKVSIAAIPY